MKYTEKKEYICYKIDTLNRKIDEYQTHYNVDICLSSNVLGMCRDFLSSEVVNNFLSIFHNTAVYYNTDCIDFVNINYVKNIRFPFELTNETLSLYLLFALSKIIEATNFKNYDDTLSIESIKVYTSSWSSVEVCYEDLNIVDYCLDQVVLSEGIISRCFNDRNLYNKLINYENEKVFTIAK